MSEALIAGLLVQELNLTRPREGLDDIDVLLIFGVCDGDIYRSYSSWLKKNDNRFLVFIETQEDLFLRAKEQPLAKDPKVRLFYFKNDGHEIFQHIAWEFVFLRFGYAVQDVFLREPAREFFLQMDHYHRGVDLLASDCEDMGLRVLSNVMKNLSFLPRSKLGSSLEGKCAGMTAIICGAGPSLDNAIPLLNELKERALLIAGGSAICALNAHGIHPHLCASIDPSPLRGRFLEQGNFEAPFFYQGRFCNELLERAHGQLLWMSDGGSYPLEAWLSAECGIFSERFDGGWTVSNFCTSLAAHLGCTTVIFVGMDLSCGQASIYASKISGAENRNALIELEKDKVYSKWDWLMSAEWTGVFAKKNPGIEWINVTNGGIDLPGIERKDLAEVAISLSDLSWDVDAHVHSMIFQAQATDVTFEKICDVRKNVKESFEKSLSLCDALLKLWEKSFPNSPMETGQYAMLDHELELEICNRYFLTPLWSVWKRPILRKSNHPLGAHVHRLLFFKKTLEMHLPYLRSLS